MSDGATKLRLKSSLSCNPCRSLDVWPTLDLEVLKKQLPNVTIESFKLDLNAWNYNDINALIKLN